MKSRYLELTILLYLTCPLVSPTKKICFRKCVYIKLNDMISKYNWTDLYNCMDIESATELFYIVFNTFF